MTDEQRSQLKERARGLLDRYAGFSFGAVMQASLLLKLSPSYVEMQSLAKELDAEADA